MELYGEEVATSATIGSFTPAKQSRPSHAAHRTHAKRCVLALCAAAAALIVLALAVGSSSAAIDAGAEAEPSAPAAAAAPTQLIHTLPANSSRALSRLAFGSCSHQHKDLVYLRTLHEHAPDLFVMLGDIVYGDCLTDGCPELPAAWDAFFANANLQEVLPSLHITGVLDDHDYGLNDCDASNPFKDLAKDEFLRRFSAPADDPRRGRGGLYTEATLGPPGRRVQLVLLDTRYFRSPWVRSGCDEGEDPTCARYVPYNESTAAALAGGPPTMLGSEQWEWLASVLAKPAELRFVVSSVQVLGERTGMEGWHNMPTELARLQDVINRTSASGVILVSGDRHIGGLYRRDAAVAGMSYPLHEVLTSSLTHTSRTMHEVDDPQRIYPVVRENHFASVDVNWAGEAVTVSFVSSDTCGSSDAEWGEMCTEPNGVAGQVLQALTIPFSALRPM